MAAKGVLFQTTIILSLAALCCLSNDHIYQYDEMIRHVPLEPSHIINRRSVDQPLRISLDFLDISRLENPKIVKYILQKASEYFSETLKVRKTVSKILLQRRCASKSFFLKNMDGNGPGNIRFCQEACDITRMLCGPIEIPEHDLDQCRVCDKNGQHCRNTSLAGYGHNNTDFILYVTAVPDGNSNCNNIKTLAYAAACQQESALDRPVVGFINICPEKVTASELRTGYNEVLATIKHEIFHALGFSPSLYAFFRNQSGDPLTPRLSNGLPRYFDSVRKHYKWSEETAKLVTRDDWFTQSGTMQHSIHLMVTPKVREEAQRHFNCSTLEGAELENQGGEGTALAHWEKRLFENEGMTGIFTQNSAFSRLTLALMEDTGWYKVNYQMAEPLRWGKNLGCLFATNSCGAWMKAQNDDGKPVAPFCDKLKDHSDGKTGCSVDRSSVAKCNLVKYEGNLPVEYQNFVSSSIPGIVGSEEQYGGSVTLADYCPYHQSFIWTKNSKNIRSSSCISHHNNVEQDKNYALETYGNASTCFEQTVKWTRTKCGVRWTASNWGSGCYRYACEQDSLKIVILGYKFSCFHEGQIINIFVQDQDWLYKGVLVCPSCREVCYDSSIICPAEVRPAPLSSQPVPKISAVTCSQCSVLLAQISSLQIMVLFVYKFAMTIISG